MDSCDGCYAFILLHSFLPTRLHQAGKETAHDRQEMWSALQNGSSAYTSYTWLAPLFQPQSPQPQDCSLVHHQIVGCESHYDILASKKQNLEKTFLGQLGNLCIGRIWGNIMEWLAFLGEIVVTHRGQRVTSSGMKYSHDQQSLLMKQSRKNTHKKKIKQTW
jgi:hypothetical protein